MALLLILLSVLVSPLVFLRQWASYLGWSSGTYSLGEGIHPPAFLLAIREGLPLLFLLFVATCCPPFWRSRRLHPVVWLFLLLVVGFAVSLLVQPYASLSLKVSIAVGVRFLLFFLLPLAVFALLSGPDPIRSKAHYRILLSVVVGVLLLNLFVSGMQVWLGSGDVSELGVGRGYTIFGARAIGITINPNVAGSLFGLSGLLMLLDLQPRWLWPGVWVASMFGSLLTGSRTGIIGTMIVGVVALMATRPKLRPALVIMSLVFTSFLLPNLDFLSGRAELLSYVRESGPFDPRIAVLANLQEMNWLERIVGRGLGYASNTAFRFLDEAEAAHAELVTADSLVTLTILEFGLLGATLFWLLASWFFLRFTLRWLSVTFLLYFVAFSLTQNLVESYPSSMLLGIILGCCAAQQYWRVGSKVRVAEAVSIPDKDG